MTVLKYVTMDKKNPKETQETEFEDELSRVSPSEQEGLKHILVAVDGVPVLIRYAWKQFCFKGCFFHDSTSQNKKLLLLLPF